MILWYITRWCSREGWVGTHVRSHGEPPSRAEHEWMNAAMRGMSAARDASVFDRDNNGWSRCSRVGPADCDTLILSETRYPISPSTTSRGRRLVIAPAQGAQGRGRSGRDDESPPMRDFVRHCILINRQVRIYTKEKTRDSLINVFEGQTRIHCTMRIHSTVRWFWKKIHTEFFNK